MKQRTSGRATKRTRQRYAPVFAALGDETRLALLARLCEQPPVSIAQLAERSPISRQAIAKHLRVLERAGLVRGEASGRQCLFSFTPKPLLEARQYLELVAKRWDEALSRLKKFVEQSS